MNSDGIMSNLAEGTTSNQPLAMCQLIRPFLINIDKDKNRLKSITEMLNRAGIDFKRISATTPASMKHIRINIEVDTYYSSACVPANLISHLKALSAFISYSKKNNEFALILEDDATPSPTLTSENLQKILDSAPANFDILQLGTSNLRASEYLINHKNKSGLLWHNWHYPLWGTHAYLITNRAAARIVEKLFLNMELNLKPFFCPDLCVADFLLYFQNNTYTSTYPWFGQLRMDSTVRSETINDEIEMMQKRNEFLRSCWSNHPRFD